MYEKIQETASWLKERMTTKPETAIILGTGLGQLATEITDIQELSDELKANPDLGTELFHNVRKVRLSIKSKGKGKRGGARIITYKCNYHDNGKCEISLLTIYDKSEISSVSDKYIKYLINLFMSKR